MSGADRGELLIVATPIGNLGDISARARDVLATVDLLCCEDTRTTGKLLSLLGIVAPKMLSLHEHNERQRAPEVVEHLLRGERVGLVCDAGTPLLSDPGARLVDAAIGAGAKVTAIPGASAALAALVVSGFAGGRFRFEGFLPRKGAERTARLGEVARSADPVVLYEAPSRVRATIADLLRVCGPDRWVAVCRELSKLYEETWRGALADAEGSPPVVAARGEYVLVVDRATEEVAGPEALEEAIGKLALAGLRRRDAAAATEVLLGVTHRAAYGAALAHPGFASGE